MNLGVMSIRELINTMEYARNYLNELSDEQEYTPEEIDEIDELQFVSGRLGDAARNVLDEFSGTDDT